MTRLQAVSGWELCRRTRTVFLTLDRGLLVCLHLVPIRPLLVPRALANLGLGTEETISQKVELEPVSLSVLQ